MKLMNYKTREEWLDLRKQGLGGTDVAAIFLVSKWRSPVDVWLEKTGQSAGQEDSMRMAIGRETEDMVARWYAETADVAVRRLNAVAIDDESHMLGSIDRLIDPPGAMARVRDEIRAIEALEVKTAESWMRKEWGEPGTDDIPDAYLCQVHAYMTVIPSLERIHVAVQFGLSDRQIYTVERQPKISAHMREYCRSWWQEHVVGGKHPEPRNEADVKALWKATRDDYAVVSDEVYGLASRLREVKDELTRLEGVEQELRNSLAVACADAPGMCIAGDRDPFVTYRHNKDSKIVQWDKIGRDLAKIHCSEDEQIALMGKYTITKPGARVMRLRLNSKEECK